MPRIFAVDWDRHEVRGLLLATGATGTSVAGAWAASLSTIDAAGLNAKQIGTRLAAAMPGPLTGKVTTIVGTGRDHVQMKLLSLPPAPADELPDMVRFQAEREFTALTSEAALDFIPLSGDAQTPHQVLAVALSPAGMTEVRELCEALGVEPDRLALRPCASAALVHRAGVIEADTVALVVNPLTDEADLTVHAGEQMFLMRTVRLPDATQPDVRQRALIGEIRRTLAAVRQQLADRQIDRVVLCGSRSAADQADALAEELETAVTMFDPSESAPPGLASQRVPGESLARFAAVLGMALNEADRRPPIVDFANVRRRAEATRFTRTHAMAAAAAAIAALGFAAHLWLGYARAVNELAAVRSEIQLLEQSQEQYEKVSADAAAIERWLTTDVNWLDELEQFARRVRPEPLSAKDYPVNDDVVLTQLIMVRPPGRDTAGGKMEVHGVAKSSSAVPGLEQRLRDQQHRVTTGFGQQDSTVPGYTWKFGLEVQVPQAAEVAEASP